MKKMIYPMEDGMQLEVEYEWDPMVLPDLEIVYERLIDCFDELRKGAGRAWSVNQKTGERESILEGLLPSDEILFQASKIASTCPRAPAFIRDAPELARRARQLCRIADWAGVEKNITRALVRRKAAEFWGECKMHKASVEERKNAFFMELSYLANGKRREVELEKTKSERDMERGRAQLAAELKEDVKATRKTAERTDKAVMAGLDKKTRREQEARRRMKEMRETNLMNDPDLLKIYKAIDRERKEQGKRGEKDNVTEAVKAVLVRPGCARNLKQLDTVRRGYYRWKKRVGHRDACQ